MSDELKSERIQLVISPSEVEAIDDWSFEHRIRSRSEAIRRLIKMGSRFESIFTLCSMLAARNMATATFVESLPEGTETINVKELKYLSDKNEEADNIISTVLDELNTHLLEMELIPEGTSKEDLWAEFLNYGTDHHTKVNFEKYLKDEGLIVSRPWSEKKL